MVQDPSPAQTTTHETQTAIQTGTVRTPGLRIAKKRLNAAHATGEEFCELGDVFHQTSTIQVLCPADDVFTCARLILLSTALGRHDQTSSTSVQQEADLSVLLLLFRASKYYIVGSNSRKTATSSTAKERIYLQHVGTTKKIQQLHLN